MLQEIGQIGTFPTKIFQIIFCSFFENFSCNQLLSSPLSQNAITKFRIPNISCCQLILFNTVLEVAVSFASGKKYCLTLSTINRSCHGKLDCILFRFFLYYRKYSSLVEQNEHFFRPKKIETQQNYIWKSNYAEIRSQVKKDQKLVEKIKALS